MFLRKLSERSAAQKAQARGALTGKYGIAVASNICYLIASLLLPQLVLALAPGSGVLYLICSAILLFVSMVFVGVLQGGLCYIYLNILFDQPTTFTDLFYLFRENHDKAFRIQTALTGITFACMLPELLGLLLFPGSDPASSAIRILLSLAGMIALLYFDLRYAMSYYLLLDFPEMDALAILRRSRLLMQGRKRALLYLRLSFLPLYLIGLLSCGIGCLWVMAYQYETSAAFYSETVAGPQGG
ncbi:MAG: DUF975 family protein [Eubacteriales bacterium]|nr:DUF975 family protein [Eubacteriales bacterium]